MIEVTVEVVLTIPEYITNDDLLFDITEAMNNMLSNDSNFETSTLERVYIAD